MSQAERVYVGARDKGRRMWEAVIDFGPNNKTTLTAYQLIELKDLVDFTIKTMKLNNAIFQPPAGSP